LGTGEVDSSILSGNTSHVARLNGACCSTCWAARRQLRALKAIGKRFNCCAGTGGRSSPIDVFGEFTAIEAGRFLSSPYQ
jgi:hypothetical protein